MSNGDTPEQDCPHLYVDEGYWGISKYCPNADARQPTKRRRNSYRRTGEI